MPAPGGRISLFALVVYTVLRRIQPANSKWFSASAGRGAARLPRRLLRAAGLGLALAATLPVGTRAAPRPRPPRQIPTPWWDAAWQFAARVTVSVGANPPFNGYAGYTARLDLAGLDPAHYQPDCDDLRIVHWNGTTNLELDRDLYQCGNPGSHLWFRLQADIPASSSDGTYYLYYGNPSAGPPPADRSQVYLWWDDFSTDPFASGRYTRTKAVDIHGDAYVAPSYDAANDRVTFNTGDNFTSDFYVNAASLSNGEQDILIQVDHFANLSYPTDATDAIVARISALNTSSTHEYIHFSHGAYSPSPACAVDSWTNGERNSLCGGVAPPVYWSFNTTETWSWAVFDTTQRFWRQAGTIFDSPDPAGRPILLSGTVSTPQSGYIGLAPSQSRGWWDNLLVRRYTEPEPAVSLGPEEAYGPPVIVDPKTDSLFADNDASGSPSAGDELGYAVLISNAGASAAEDVAFTDTPDGNTALVVGSVAASRGVVTSGNNPGDVSVAVGIGLLAPGETVTVSFRVQIDDPLPSGLDQISNQGLVTAANLTPTPTDDPATSAPADPTITLLGRLAAELPATGFPPHRAADNTQRSTLADSQRASLWLEIPRLSVRGEIVGATLQPAGWDLSWLSSQLAYLEGTAYPTLPGNSVLAGHALLADGTPGPLARLGELRWGDTILIHNGSLVHVYEVRRVQVLSADDLSPLQHEDYSWVTLITCVGFDPETEAYPWRLAVQAVLLAVDPSGEPGGIPGR